MNTDKENVNDKIRELSLKIKQSSGDWFEDSEWAPYEWKIAEIIIDYSISHNIKIPLINYDWYSKVREDSVKEVKNVKSFKRKKMMVLIVKMKKAKKSIYTEKIIYFLMTF